MMKKIYVGNLNFAVDDAALSQLFGRHGKVKSAQVIRDRETQQSKGFGFVEMETNAEADAAIAGINGTVHQGRTLNVNEARPREDRGNRR